MDDLKTLLYDIGHRAKTAAARLANVSSEMKNDALESVALSIDAQRIAILEANAEDVADAERKGTAPAMVDRLRLTDSRIDDICDAVRYLKRLDDPVGKLLDRSERPNGITIDKVSVPIGVIGIIYESRPNVTVDASMICLKAGNATILRGGGEAFRSNTAFMNAIREGLRNAGLPEDAVQYLPITDRAAVNVLIRMDGLVDLVIPRGGESLIRAVTENATVPVIKHYKGVCHAYVDSDFDPEMAVNIILNGKCQRPGVCNALEKVILHKDIVSTFASTLADALQHAGVEMVGDERFCACVKDAVLATADDWDAEYLSLKLAVKVTDSLDEAITWINAHGSHHSDCIISHNAVNAEKFMSEVDSAVVYHNASTRFTDGGEFGMGAEIGISTDKLHARGPMGLPELTTYQYRVRGTGQIR